jgi:hypothetical protein
MLSCWGLCCEYTLTFIPVKQEKKSILQLLGAKHNLSQLMTVFSCDYEMFYFGYQ